MNQYKYTARLLAEDDPGKFKPKYVAFSNTCEDLSQAWKSLPLPKRRYTRWKITLSSPTKTFQKIYPRTNQLQV